MKSVVVKQKLISLTLTTAAQLANLRMQNSRWRDVFIASGLTSVLYPVTLKAYRIHLELI